MNNKNILPYDWFSNFFNPLDNRGFFDRSDVFRDFEDRYREGRILCLMYLMTSQPMHQVN